jgi:hypothetical protein
MHGFFVREALRINELIMPHKETIHRKGPSIARLTRIPRDHSLTPASHQREHRDGSKFERKSMIQADFRKHFYAGAHEAGRNDDAHHMPNGWPS